jgi:hypothetical protein
MDIVDLSDDGLAHALSVLMDAVRELLDSTDPYMSALEGRDDSVDLEQIWHRLAGLVGYERKRSDDVTD